jgi:hypothetical protein
MILYNCQIYFSCLHNIYRKFFCPSDITPTTHCFPLFSQWYGQSQQEIWHHHCGLGHKFAFPSSPLFSPTTLHTLACLSLSSTQYPSRNSLSVTIQSSNSLSFNNRFVLMLFPFHNCSNTINASHQSSNFISYSSRVFFCLHS